MPKQHVASDLFAIARRKCCETVHLVEGQLTIRWFYLIPVHFDLRDHIRALAQHCSPEIRFGVELIDPDGRPKKPSVSQCRLREAFSSRRPDARIKDGRGTPRE